MNYHSPQRLKFYISLIPALFAVVRWGGRAKTCRTKAETPFTACSLGRSDLPVKNAWGVHLSRIRGGKFYMDEKDDIVQCSKQEESRSKAEVQSLLNSYGLGEGEQSQAQDPHSQIGGGARLEGVIQIPPQFAGEISESHLLSFYKDYIKSARLILPRPAARRNLTLMTSPRHHRFFRTTKSGRAVYAPPDTPHWVVEFFAPKFRVTFRSLAARRAFSTAPSMDPSIILRHNRSSGYQDAGHKLRELFLEQPQLQHRCSPPRHNVKTLRGSAREAAGLPPSSIWSKGRDNENNVPSESLKAPSGICVSRDGTLIVLDDREIRRLDPSSGVVTSTVSLKPGRRDGPLDIAKFGELSSIVLCESGCDPHEEEEKEGGGGRGGGGEEKSGGVGNNLPPPPPQILYACDSINNQIRCICNGRVTTLAGKYIGYRDGRGSLASFNDPSGLTCTADGTLYVSDSGNFKIRKVTPSGEVTTIAGSHNKFAYADGPSSQAAVQEQQQPFLPFFPGRRPDDDDDDDGDDDDGKSLEGCSSGNHHHHRQGTLRRCSRSQAATETHIFKASYFPPPSFRDASSQNAAAAAAAATGIGMVSAITVDRTTGDLYFAPKFDPLDRMNNRIRMLKNGSVSTIAGNGDIGIRDGKGTKARFGAVTALTWDRRGLLYLCDTLPSPRWRSSIRRVDLNTREVTTVAGGSFPMFSDGKGTYASFGYPCAITPAGHQQHSSGEGVHRPPMYYIADKWARRIRVMSEEGEGGMEEQAAEMDLERSSSSSSSSSQKLVDRPNPSSHRSISIDDELPATAVLESAKSQKIEEWFHAFDLKGQGQLDLESLASTIDILMQPYANNALVTLRAGQVLEKMNHRNQQQQQGSSSSVVLKKEWCRYLSEHLRPEFAFENATAAYLLADLFGWEDLLEIKNERSWPCNNLKKESADGEGGGGGRTPKRRTDTERPHEYPFWGQTPYAYPNKSLPLIFRERYDNHLRSENIEPEEDFKRRSRLKHPREAAREKRRSFRLYLKDMLGENSRTTDNDDSADGFPAQRTQEYARVG